MEDLIKIEEACRQARLALDNTGKTYVFSTVALISILIIAFWHKIPISRDNDIQSMCTVKLLIEASGFY